jgi:hypothetical protein
MFYTHAGRSIIETEEKKNRGKKKKTVRMKEKKKCFKVYARPIETLWPM